MNGRHRSLFCSFGLPVTALCSLCVVTSDVVGDDIFWVGYQADCVPTLTVFNASFHHGDNWFNFVTPGPGDTAFFGTGFDPDGRMIQRNVYFGDFCFDVFPCPPGFIVPARTAQLDRIMIQDETYSFDMGPGFIPLGSCAFDVVESGGLNLLAAAPDNPLVVGADKDSTGLPGDAELLLEGGTLVSPAGRLGLTPGSTGMLTISGDEAEAFFSTWFDAGTNGSGTLRVERGATFVLNDAPGGEPQPRMSVGLFADTSGTVEVDGPGSSLFIDGFLGIGREGRGDLHVHDGGFVAVTGDDILALPRGLAAIGESTTGSGELIVTGAGSEYQQTGEFYIGFEGQGTVTVADGAALRHADWRFPGPTVPRVSIGTMGSGVGVLSVLGQDSIATVVGQLLVGATGTGGLNVSDGGRLVVFSTTDGLNGLIIVGLRGDSVGNVQLAGADTRVESQAQIQVGDEAEGAMRMAAGASLLTGKSVSPTNSSGIIGTEATGRGVVTIEGSGTRWSQDGALNVGLRGSGELRITDGGRVESDQGFIARFGSSTGIVEIDGRQSAWIVSSELFIGGNESQSSIGQATLHLRDGGTVGVAGSMTLWPPAAILAEIGGADPIRFFSSGQASLDGSLDVSLADGYVPSLGDRHLILSGSPISGQFDQVELPEAPAGIAARLVYEGDTDVAVLFACLADFDADGILTIFDFLAFQNAFDAGCP